MWSVLVPLLLKACLKESNVSRSQPNLFVFSSAPEATVVEKAAIVLS
jgi:hypothetical protein